MRILHCIPSFSTGGAERQLSILALAQAQAGLDVHVAYLYDGPEQRRLDGSAVRLHRLAARSNHDVRLPFRLFALIRDVRPDLIQTWLPQMDIVGGLVSMASGISWLVAERSGPEAYATRLKDRFIRPLVGRRVRAVIANSEGGRDVWRQAARRGVPVTVIRNTLPLDEIHATKATPLSDVGVSSSTPVVIFVGRLTPEKNIDVLRDVAQRVVSRSTAVVLICGDGPLRQMLEDSVRSSQLDDRIKLLGYRSDVAGLLKSARVFVSTSSFEGNPNAVLEAMACRVSLVVSDISAHREFLDESSAALVSVTDRERFAREIIDAVNGSPESRGRTANAFARVSMLTPATAARQYVDVYQQVLEKHS